MELVGVVPEGASLQLPVTVPCVVNHDRGYNSSGMCSSLFEKKISTFSKGHKRSVVLGES